MSKVFQTENRPHLDSKASLPDSSTGPLRRTFVQMRDSSWHQTAATKPGVASSQVCKDHRIPRKTSEDRVEGHGVIQHLSLGPKLVSLAFVHQSHCVVNFLAGLYPIGAQSNPKNMLRQTFSNAIIDNLTDETS